MNAGMDCRVRYKNTKMITVLQSNTIPFGSFSPLLGKLFASLPTVIYYT